MFTFLSTGLFCFQLWSEKVFRVNSSYNKGLEINDCQVHSPKWDIYLTLSKAQGTSQRRVVQKYIRTRGRGRMLQHAVFLDVKLPCHCSPEIAVPGVTWTRLCATIPSTIPEENMALTGYWGRKSLFLQWCSHWIVAHAPVNNLQPMHMKTAWINSADHKTQEDMKDNKLSGKRKLGREGYKECVWSKHIICIDEIVKNFKWMKSESIKCYTIRRKFC